MTEKILVTGTRKKGYDQLVRTVLNQAKERIPNFIIIEGCCPDSADKYAEKWAKENNIEILHFPSNSGNYLKRNIEMVEKCTQVIAFWDGFSYGTAHTIAQAKMRNKPIRIVQFNIRG